MLINEHTAIRSNKGSLVPYTKRHVPEYHEWMQDPEIQTATASEPLTLTEEYAMQESWRKDGDKLTFIVTKAAGEEAIGDVNLFITTKDDDDDDDGKQSIVGELELMIARKEEQGKGHGRAAILLFLMYILSHRAEILKEYNQKHDGLGRGGFDYFSVKIGEGNSRSIKLFETLGFNKVAEEANFFGEFELRLAGENLGLEEVQEMLDRYDVRDYEEEEYDHGLNEN